MPLVVGASVLALDYAALVAQKSRLQALADSAALAAAKGLRLSNATADNVLALARTHVETAAEGSVEFSGLVSPGASVSVDLKQVAQTSLASFFAVTVQPVTASATAKVVGGAPVCALALEPEASDAFQLSRGAKLLAPSCAIMSNSRAASSIKVADTSQITARAVGARGGIVGSTPGNYSVEPQRDVPSVPDPLASRPPPAGGACNFVDLKITASTVLVPGVYCGGLDITSAEAQLSPGVYVIKDGQLKVNPSASLIGSDVGFFLTGEQPSFLFQPGSTITLSAPLAGPMAGILFFEDRAVAKGARHVIKSLNARNLIGTIYLPRGVFEISAPAKVSDQSAYTIIVAGRIEITGGPEMALNTNYAASAVPVPNGVGPNAGSPVLTK